MNIVRINSFYREGLVAYKDSTLVIYCCLDNEQKLTQGTWPGVITDERLKTPFLLKVDGQSVVWFNKDDCPITTIGQRAMRPTELFTVGTEWIYEVRSTYQYVSPTGNTNGGLLKKMVKMTAECVDDKRWTRHVFVLWCGLDERGCVMEGEWMGYCEDDDTVTPIVVSIGSFSEVNYGDNIKESTDLMSGQVGHHFTIKSTDKNEQPDIYRYEIREQFVYEEADSLVT